LKKNPHGLSFTAKYNSITRILLTNVYIESPINNNRIEAKAIWDTGASQSLIRPEIAKKLDLKPVSKTLMSTPSGKGIQSNVYSIYVHLPNGARIVNVFALEGIPNICDMLIGMDIISLGDFAITNNNGKSMFSFRIPSMAEIDFTKHSYIQQLN